MNLVVVTHGSLALGFRDVLELMCGDLRDVYFISMDEGGVVGLRQRLRLLFNSLGDSTLILTDILSGSPFVVVLDVVSEFLFVSEVVSGVNFSMLLEAYLSLGRFDFGVYVNRVISAGIEGIGVGEFKVDCLSCDEF